MTFMFKFDPLTPPMIESVGSPPDRHAERIVDEMLVWLFKRSREVWLNSKGTFNHKQMGNPVGQERAVERLKQAIGDLLLHCHLEPGKRGKFHLTLVQWMIWNSTQGLVCNPKTEPPPPTAWIAIATSFCDRDLEWRTAVPMLVTRHAMVRLAQRAGVRTVPDLLLAMRELWWVLYELVVRDDTLKGHWTDPPPEGWRLPMDRGAIAVVGREEQGMRRMLVKTILNPKADT